MTRSLSLAALLLAAVPSLAAGKVDFTRDIQPILADKCFACHGPDPKTRKADLRLDVREDAVREAIVPGKSADSEAYLRVTHADAGKLMPPPKFNKPLKPAEIALLKQWIDEGAEYQTHWAFRKPTRPATPAVKVGDWAKTDIDRFILARLEAKGLKPAPEADRATLVRRVSIDLRGFGPTAAEAAEFVNDKNPDAYERMVDRMLASPHYGEKMAMLWMDLARFGDTSGYHFDSTRQMWLWRDQVIKDYNANKPFDQFTTEQLAGDLIPGATVEQKIASGFNRNTRFNEEGGADPDEFVVRYTVDRTNTLGSVWLGLTVGCAECHSHKYDPISQKEYYQLYAYFTGIKEPHASGNHGQALPPLVKVASKEQEAAIAKLKADIDATNAELAAALKAVTYQEPDTVTAKPREPADVVWIDDEPPAGAQLTADGSGAKWPWGDAPKQPVLSGKRSTKRSHAGLAQHYFTGATNTLEVRAGDKLFAYVYLDPKNPPKSVMLQFNDGSWEHRAYWGEDKCFLAGSPDAANHHRAGDLPKAGEWARLEVDVAKVGLAAGAKINGWAFTQFDGTAYYDKAGIQTTGESGVHLFSLAAWEKVGKTDAKVPADVKAALNTDPQKRNDAQKTLILNHFLRHVHAGSKATFDPLNKRLDELAKSLKAAEDAIPSAMVSEESDKPRDAHILIRGDFLQKGEKVERGVPAAFPPLPKDAPANRLGLAKWLTSPDHPLTARVAANRLWAQMFGAGLVRSLGDFGTQGDFPSHPELLDWLATEYQRTGWDTKAMLKTMAMSAAYRQSSAFVGKAPEADPDNRLLYKSPRFRMSAEEVRDNALRVAGLLSPKIGGPSVMPYQPGDFYKGKNEGWGWNVAQGEDLYRRGIYTFWRRTSLHPMYAIFDAPSREECTVFRPRTNTPLQALVTLNDPTFVEAARVFAQRVLKDGPADADGRIRFAFQAALVREPMPAEAAALRRRYDKLLERYRADPKAAADVVKAGTAPAASGMDPAEHAAMTGLTGILLNLDETITRE